MGLFSLFKKDTKSVSQNNSVKSFDYFSFKVHGTATIPGAQDVLKSIGNKLYEQPRFVLVELEGDTLNVYLNGKCIGSGDTQARNKFIKHCQNKWNVHSCSIYGGDDGKNFGCKIRIKYFN